METISLLPFKYLNGSPAISGLKRISSPGRRVYVGSQAIPKVQNGLGISIISTSSGVMAGKTAQEKMWAANFFAKFGRGRLCHELVNCPLLCQMA